MISRSKPAPPQSRYTAHDASPVEHVLDPYPMDQGIAAFVAGVAGMVGALGGAVAGAVGAVRGARVGAEKTAEATRRQVQDQAAAEHHHWLRQQRQAAYSSFITAIQTAERTAKTAMDSSPSTSSLRTGLQCFEESLDELVDVSSQITILGPHTMIEAAKQVFRRSLVLRDTMSRYDQGGTWTQDEIDQVDQAWDHFVEAGAEFEHAARDVLVSPP